MGRTERPQIKTFWLALTYGCNNHCAGCYAEHSQFVDRPMDFDQAIRICGMMKEMGASDCLLIGGEPTLYPRLAELIRAGSQFDIEFKLVTNGRRLANPLYIRSLVDVGLKHASISVEGSSAKVHNAVTRTLSFRETMAGVENCLRLGLSFNTLLTVSRHNFGEVIPLAELMHKMGVVNILFNVGLPSAGGSQEKTESFALSPAHTAQIVTDAYLALKAKGIKVKFFATIPLCLFDQSLLDEMMTIGCISDGVHCHIFYGSGAVFEPNGNVLPCTHFVGRPLFNLSEQSVKTATDFAKVWYGRKGIHGVFRREIWRYPHEKCKGCRHWGKCVGGCPFLWTHFDPEEIISRKEVKE
ncbi:MAG: radical SAM protein [Patescibacteria group bacterium]